MVLFGYGFLIVNSYRRRGKLLEDIFYKYKGNVIFL